MSTNWPVITGVLTSAGVLGGGVVGIVVKALFQRPETMASIDTTNIDASIKLLRECMTTKQQLRKEYNALRRYGDKRDRRLADTEKELLQTDRKLYETREALKLVIGLPILQQAGDLEELIMALDAVQKMLDKP